MFLSRKHPNTGMQKNMSEFLAVLIARVLNFESNHFVLTWIAHQNYQKGLMKMIPSETQVYIGANFESLCQYT